MGGGSCSTRLAPATVGSSSPKLTSISSIFERLGGFMFECVSEHLSAESSTPFFSVGLAYSGSRLQGKRLANFLMGRLCVGRWVPGIKLGAWYENSGMGCDCLGRWLQR